MDVRATIIAHQSAGLDEAGHRFVFTIQDELNTPRENVISLHVARVLAQELPTSTAFGQMILQIVETNAEDYDLLVDQEFKHL